MLNPSPWRAGMISLFLLRRGCFIFVGIAIWFVSVFSLKAETMVTLDEILDRAEALQKISFPEKLAYLKSEEKTASGFLINDKLRFEIALAESHLYMMQDREARLVVEKALKIPVNGLEPEALKRAGAMRRLLQGILYFLDKKLPSSLVSFQAAEGYFNEVSDLENQAFALEWMGELQYRTGQYEDGYASFREAARIFDQLGKRAKMADALLSAGTSGVVSDLDEVMKTTLDLLEIFKEEGDIDGMAAAYQNMGYDYNPDKNRSIGFFQQAITLGKQVGDMGIYLAAVAGKAEMLVQVDKVSEAVDTIEAGLEEVALFEHADVEAHLFRVAGVVYTAVGDETSFAKARDYLNKSFQFYERDGDVELMQACKEDLARLELAMGNAEAALPIAIEVTEWYRLNQEELYPAGLKLQEKIYEKMRDYESALRINNAYWNVIQAEWKSGLAEKYEILQKDYETAQKKSEINLLEKENLLKNQQITSLEEQRSQAKKIRLFEALLILSLLIILVFVIYLMLSHHQNMKHSIVTARVLETQNRELQEANFRLKAVSEQRKKILGVASHDLKNPLASVSSTLEMLEDDLQSPDVTSKSSSILELVELSKQSVDYMRELIQKLLDSQLHEANAENLHLEVLNPVEPLRQMVTLNQMAAKKKSITLSEDLDETLNVMADSQVLKEVIDNLLSNAVKYTPLGGRVDIRLMPAGEKNKEVHLVFSDNGPGIPEEEQSQLFQPFSNLSPKPTAGESSNGLGLSIAKTLVDSMGGDIRFRNKPMGGAEFTLILPKVETVGTGVVLHDNDVETA